MRKKSVETLSVMLSLQKRLKELGSFKGNAGCKSKFIATSGWFNCFLNKTGLQHVVIHGEAASTDIESVSKDKGELSDLANIN